MGEKELSMPLRNLMSREIKLDLERWCPVGAESIKLAMMRAVRHYMAHHEDCPVLWTCSDTLLDVPSHDYDHADSSVALSDGSVGAVWATDGSEMGGVAGYGLVSGMPGKVLRGRVSGAQTNNAGEALGILRALLATALHVPLTIVTDSQVCIDNIARLLGRGNC